MIAALIRGINVGGTKTIAMSDLRDELTDAGFASVQTLLQSGNVVVASTEDPVRVARTIETRIAARFGHDVTVIARTQSDLAQVVAANPFAGAEPPKNTHVVFLDTQPEAAAVAELDHDRALPDVFRVAGREIYVRYANGAAGTKLTLDWFERRLGVRATARNLNTVEKLLALVSAG